MSAPGAPASSGPFHRTHRARGQRWPAGERGAASEASGATPPEQTAVRRLLAASASIAGLTVVAAAIVRLGASAEAGESFLWLFGWQETSGGLLALLACGLAGLTRSRVLARSVEGLARIAAARPVVAALLSAVVMALLAGTIGDGYPLTADEYLPVFQARIFAAGELTGHWPPDLIAWLAPPEIGPVFYLVLRGGEVASAYWPGFALLLTPFAAAGVEWLLDPLLAGSAVALLAALARRLYPADPASPGWVILLALASPAFVVNGVSLYSMTAHLTANLLFALLLAGRGRGRAAAAGVVGSLALVLHNPVPHALFALPWVAWIAARRERRRQLLPLIVGYLPCAIAIGGGWLLLRKGAYAGPLPPFPLAAPFSLPDADGLWIRLLELLRACSWAVPGLPVLAMWGVVLVRRTGGREARELAGLLVASLLAVLLAYGFLRGDQGHGWGYRHLHYAWGALPLLGAAPLVWRDRDGGLLQAVGVLLLVSLTAGNGLRLWELARLHEAERVSLAPQPASAPAVCFVTAAYNLHQIRNDPFLRDPVLMLASRGQQDEAVLRARFPRRRRIESPRGVDCWAVDSASLRALRQR